MKKNITIVAIIALVVGCFYFLLSSATYPIKELTSYADLDTQLNQEIN